jgi:hypothetical protein
LIVLHNERSTILYWYFYYYLRFLINLAWDEMTKDEKIALSKIAGLGCILCSEVLGIAGSPAELHHVRRYGAKRSTSPVLPLCPEHHRGNSGVHGLGAKGFEAKWGVTFTQLLESVSERLGEQT